MSKQFDDRRDIVPIQEALKDFESSLVYCRDDREQTKKEILEYDPLAFDKNGDHIPERIEAYWEYKREEDRKKGYDPDEMCVGRKYCMICEKWTGCYEDFIHPTSEPPICKWCWEKDELQEVMRKVDPNEIVFIHTKEIIPEHIKGLNPVVAKQDFNLDYKRLTCLQRFESDLIFRVRMKKQRDEYYDHNRKRRSAQKTEYENLMDHYEHYHYFSFNDPPEPKLHVICEMCNGFVCSAKLMDILTEPRICEMCYSRPEVQEVFRRIDPDNILKEKMDRRNDNPKNFN
jgi:hypothetical protein